MPSAGDGLHPSMFGGHPRHGGIRDSYQYPHSGDGRAMANLDEILAAIIRVKRGALKDHRRLLARLEAGVDLKAQAVPKCPIDCVMRDQPLIGRKDFANFLGVGMDQLDVMNQLVGVPHAVVGNRWVGTTHTVMRWLTKLVEEQAIITHDEQRRKGRSKQGRVKGWGKWAPDEEILKRFRVDMVGNRTPMPTPADSTPSAEEDR